MKDFENPFPLSGYTTPEEFCDREEETKRIQKNLLNGINTTLLSLRRMGKTGLIHHVFNHLQKKGIVCIYCDIYATKDLRGFANQLSSAAIRAFPEKKNAGKKFMQFLKGLRPVISYDTLSGEPQVTLDFVQPKQYEHSVESIFRYLENQNKKVVIAFDEFQQVVTYPGNNMEAFLRSSIQNLKNINFIFSGSSMHMLTEMFSSAARPFFASTDSMHLGHIDAETYMNFIKEKFTLYKRKIDRESLEFIAEWSRLHTFYTQYLSNKMFATGNKNVMLDDVKKECDNLLKEQENIFFQYRNLLTTIQWNLLRAIAREDKVYKPMSGEFIGRYKVGTPANVQRSLESLRQKEMIYREESRDGGFYRVYDCFLARWFQRGD